MNTTSKLRTAWIVAGILAVLLIIMTALWARSSGAFTLDAKDLAAERNKVNQACDSGESLTTPECQDALESLTKLLKSFENKLNREVREAAKNNPNPPADTGTSTAPLGS